MPSIITCILEEKVNELDFDAFFDRGNTLRLLLDVVLQHLSKKRKEVTINVPVPPGTKSRFIVCEIKKNHIKVGLKGQPPTIDGGLLLICQGGRLLLELRGSEVYLHSPGETRSDGMVEIPDKG